VDDAVSPFTLTRLGHYTTLTTLLPLLALIFFGAAPCSGSRSALVGWASADGQLGRSIAIAPTLLAVISGAQRGPSGGPG